MSLTDTLRRAYDRDAGDYDARFVDQQRPKAVEMARIVTPPPAGRVLDVGCGTGLLRGWLVGADPAWGTCQWTGLDLSRGMLSRASSLERVQGDGRALPFARASFDRVLCLTGIVWPEDVRAALVSAVRVAKPGGVIAFSLRLDAWLPAVVDGLPLASLSDVEVEGDRLRAFRRT